MFLPTIHEQELSSNSRLAQPLGPAITIISGDFSEDSIAGVFYALSNFRIFTGI